MQPPLRLFLLRHAEVEVRYHRVFGGRIDMNLSPLGHEQAAALGTYLRRIPFDAIYASPMKRVQQTLLPIAAEHHCTPRILEDLREVDFGDWTGLGWDQVMERFKISAYQWLETLEKGFANGESAVSFRARVEPCVEQILTENTSGNVAIVCHGGVIRMLLAILLKLPLPAMASFDVEYASLTQVNCSPLKREVQLLNFTPWRDLP